MVIIISQRAWKLWSVHGHYNISKSMCVMESTWSSKYLIEHGKCGVYKDIIIPPRACELWRAHGHYNISKSMEMVECTWTL